MKNASSALPETAGPIRALGAPGLPRLVCQGCQAALSKFPRESFAGADMPESWGNFFIAEVGATAALVGLVIVAISINLSRILEYPELPGRAAEAIAVLAGALILSSLTLIPQNAFHLGLEVLAVAIVVWSVPIVLQFNTRRTIEPSGYTRPISRFLLTQLNTLPFVIAGVAITLGWPSGFYWLAAGVLLALMGALINTWVLLVEILR